MTGGGNRLLKLNGSWLCFGLFLGFLIGPNLAVFSISEFLSSKYPFVIENLCANCKLCNFQVIWLDTINR